MNANQVEAQQDLLVSQFDAAAVSEQNDQITAIKRALSSNNFAYALAPGFSVKSMTDLSVDEKDSAINAVEGVLDNAGEVVTMANVEGDFEAYLFPPNANDVLIKPYNTVSVFFNSNGEQSMVLIYDI